MTQTIHQPPAGGTATRPWPRAVAVAVGLTVLAFVLSLLTGIATFRVLDLAGIGSRSTLGFVTLLVATQGTFLALGAWYVRGRLPITVRVPSRGEAGWIVGGVVLALVVAVVLGALRAVLFPETGSALAETLSRNTVLLLYLAVLSVVLIAPAEELLFRGAIQGRLRGALGAVGGIVGASALFGLMHLLNFTGPLAGGLAAAAVVGAASVVWGYIYERTGNLAVPVLAHGLYNATLMGVGYLALTMV